MKKTLRDILTAGLVLAGTVGGVYMMNQDSIGRENKRQEAIYDATVRINRDLDANQSREHDQEVLDSLRVNYTLKEGEWVRLDFSRVGASVNIHSTNEPGWAINRGFVNLASLERYLTSIQNSQVGQR